MNDALTNRITSERCVVLIWIVKSRRFPYSAAVSSAMLLACQVEVLVKIGATIVANTVVGYLLSLMLFSSLMATFGD